MIERVDFHRFLRAFERAGRRDQFTPEALRFLFDYFEEMESDGGPQIELDVVAICCEFSEYTTAIKLLGDAWYPHSAEAKCSRYLAGEGESAPGADEMERAARALLREEVDSGHLDAMAVSDDGPWLVRW